MRIAITVPSLSSLDINAGGNVQGDEIVARAWAKYLKPYCSPALFQGNVGEQPNFDAVIHFGLLYEPWPHTKNILYLQNAFPPEAWPGGTVGQFNAVQSKYDAFFFASDILRDRCNITDRPTAVVPFAVDPDIFYKIYASEYAHYIVFVGNNIRGKAINDMYLKPALKYGLVIYGNKDAWGGDFSAACRGKINVFPNEVAVYSSSKVCLNCHINEHAVHDTINYRIYCILAAGGFIISDKIPSLERDFAGAVVFTDGNGDLEAKLQYYLCHQGDTIKYRNAGLDIVLSSHTFKHRAAIVVELLKELL